MSARSRGRTDNLPRAGIQMGERVRALAPPIRWWRIFRRMRKSRRSCTSAPGPPAADRGAARCRRARRVFARNGSRPGFRRCATSPTRCNGSVSRSALAVIYVVTNLRRACRRRTRRALTRAARVPIPAQPPAGACLIGRGAAVLRAARPRIYLYYGHVGWRPGGRVNHGELIDPPRPLPALTLPVVDRAAARRRAGGGAVTAPIFSAHKWTFLYWGPGTCCGALPTDLYNTRQVRIALDRDMDRVQRVFVAEGACCDLDFLARAAPGSDHGARNGRCGAACSRCSRLRPGRRAGDACATASISSIRSATS